MPKEGILPFAQDPKRKISIFSNLHLSLSISKAQRVCFDQSADQPYHPSQRMYHRLLVLRPACPPMLRHDPDKSSVFG